jgi:hypothetical protein
VRGVGASEEVDFVSNAKDPCSVRNSREPTSDVAVPLTPNPLSRVGERGAEKANFFTASLREGPAVRDIASVTFRIHSAGMTKRRAIGTPTRSAA